MRIGQVTRAFVDGNSHTANGSVLVSDLRNELNQSMFKYEKRFEATNLQFNKNPDWSHIPTKAEEYVSDEVYEKEIKALAKLHYESGIDPNSDRDLKKLENDFISQSSPDRKGIFNISMEKTEGKMNISCGFFDKFGNIVMTYNPHNATYSSRMTDAEFDRSRLFNQIYNDEYNKLDQNSDYVDLRGVMSNSSIDIEI